MNILGISSFYHDSAACLLQDGHVVAAAQEERFSRIKHDPAFPTQAMAWCLEHAGLSGSDIDLVAFHEKPLHKFDRILDTCMSAAPAGRKRFADTLPSWFLQKLRVPELLDEHIGYRGELIYAQHHESHAASAFFLSPFSEAAVLTIDGVGEWATNAMGVGEGNQLRLHKQIRFPHSLGLLYSAFTQFLGFRVNNGEYKVMGLAPYGTPRFRDIILEKMIDLREDGSYRLRLECFDFIAGDSTISEHFAEVLGCPVRPPETRPSQVHMDVARSIQAVTEEVLLRQARTLRAETGKRHLCMAGGVALNSVANGKILQAGIFDDLWIQPAAGDAGGCLGAALIGWHHVAGQPRPAPKGDGMQGARLGPSFSPEAIEAALAEHDLTGEELDPDTMADRVAGLIDDGAVVGWFQGRMEFGPRALGSRSILADPRRAEMQRRVNAKIKFREGFRPFAPAVHAPAASSWFELESPSPYMLLVIPVAESRRRQLTDQELATPGLAKLDIVRSEIPAVTHVDDSARVQTVPEDLAHPFHRLVVALDRRTQCPVVLNTSFNLRGEPIVCTPHDAVRTFLASGMDALALGHRLVMRPPDRAPTGQCPPPPPPAPPKPTSAHDLRTFGLGGGLIITLLALLNASSHPQVATVLLVLAAAFGFPGAIRPTLLAPVEKVMARFGKRLGHINAKILLSGIYWGVLTPTAWARRALSGDPLDRHPDSQRTSYWEDADPSALDTPEKYRRMF